MSRAFDVVNFPFQLKENGEKDETDTVDPDCATLSKKFSFSAKRERGER
jgi:hypothetical protein